jgi:hypothetical protein
MALANEQRRLSVFGSIRVHRGRARPAPPPISPMTPLSPIPTRTGSDPTPLPFRWR